MVFFMVLIITKNYKDKTVLFSSLIMIMKYSFVAGPVMITSWVFTHLKKKNAMKEGKKKNQ